MEQRHPRYVIISPVRDEEKFIESTIRSVAAQTILPSEWVIVDDGSTDRTGEIIDRYAAEHSWIRPLHRANRGFRKSGGGVMEAFEDGLNNLSCKDWDFIVKLDGDLIFAAGYFENCFKHFHEDPKLGIGGGSLYHLADEKETIEEAPRFHVRGATKIYKRDCWIALGGLWCAPGWDTIDEVKANMLGWTSMTFSDLKVRHQRPTGTAESLWRDLIKSGTARYVAGYHPLFIVASCLRRMLRKPYFRGSAGLLCGYALGYWRNTPRVNDSRLIRYIREQQLRRLLGRDTIWR